MAGKRQGWLIAKLGHVMEKNQEKMMFIFQHLRDPDPSCGKPVRTSLESGDGSEDGSAATILHLFYIARLGGIMAEQKAKISAPGKSRLNPCFRDHQVFVIFGNKERENPSGICFKSGKNERFRRVLR
jgi:hypothetical protein